MVCVCLWMSVHCSPSDKHSVNIGSAEQNAPLLEHDLLYLELFLSSSYSPFSFFFLLLSLHPQVDGLKEGDYLVAIGDTDCKWMGVSEVMKLLKDADEEFIDIKVISMIDSSTQAMVTFPTSWSLKEQLEQLLCFLNRL